MLDRLAEIDVDVQSVADRLDRLEGQVAPGRGFISEQEALERYQDCVYLHMIEEHELAAEGFFTLVTTASLGEAGLHRDAEWYLAESLYELGNVATAEARYLVIADDDDHPFREDAVRRLLELYAETGQEEEFDRYYREEILNGRVRPSDLITYTLARSFYTQGRHDLAREHFARIGEDSPYWGRARYFLGVLDVLGRDLDAAKAHFEAVTTLSGGSFQERQLRDLALLALGRIAYEQEDFEAASTWYGEIGGDSEYLADKLYETVWTFIKQGEYRAALDGVEIFLIRFPEHAYTAQLKLLEGHLQMEKREYDLALLAYESVVADYRPVRDQFGELAAGARDTRPYFEAILSAERTGWYESADVPGYALAMMRSDEGLSRALDVYRDLERQERQIGESEVLIAELEQVLSSDVGLGGFEHLRYDLGIQKDKAVRATLALLATEEAWLAEQGADVRERLVSLRQRREALGLQMEALEDDLGVQERRMARQRYFEELELLEGQVSDLQAEAASIEAELAALAPDDPGRGALEVELQRVERDLDDLLQALETLRSEGPRSEWEIRHQEAEAAFAAEVASLRRAYRELRGAISTPDKDLIVARMDGLYANLEHSIGRLVALRGRLGTMESSELARIRARFAHEVREVAAQRVELQITLDEADTVSRALTEAGFGRLEDFFADSILRADMGIVDVYWARTLDIVDQRTRVAEEKVRLLKDLEMRFDIIRQKMGSRE